MKQDSKTKQLDWRGYLDIAIRRRWLLLGPFFALGLAGFIVAHVWPARFRSEAMILVDEQKVPDKYVMPNVVSSAETRLNSMTQEILSRTRLQEIIDKFGLYPQERGHNTADQLVDQMRQDIEITPGVSKEHPDQLTEFQISYAAPSSATAQQVVNDLTSLFIKENIENRTQQSMSTTSFFESQLDQARKDLSNQEHQLAAYKSRYLGELPQQEQSNLQILSELQAQVSAASTALDRAQQEKGIPRIHEDAVPGTGKLTGWGGCQCRCLGRSRLPASGFARQTSRVGIRFHSTLSRRGQHKGTDRSARSRQEAGGGGPSGGRKRRSKQRG